MTDLALPGVAYAEANWGQWKARCPRLWCTNAMPIDRGQEQFACLGPDSCGWTGEVAWPPDPDAIETLLLMRPVPRTRNWLPGESLEDLLQENVAHGIELPSVGGATGPVTVAVIVEDRLVGGLLHQQITAAGPRPQIGA